MNRYDIEIDGEPINTTTSYYLKALAYCLDRDFPADTTAAVLAVVNESDQDNLDAAWESYRDNVSSFFGDFANMLDRINDDSAIMCADCGAVVWQNETSVVIDGYGYSKSVCDDNCLDNYTACGDCGSMATETTTVNSDEVCSYCLNRNYSFCENCDAWYHDDDSDDHDHDRDCDCQPSRPRFEFPANGHGTVANDEKLTVTLPKGTIDKEGLRRIERLFLNELPSHPLYLPGVFEEIGDEWQTKRGNFTRRLSSFCHKNGVKIPPAMLTEIGNIARQHSQDTTEFVVEFTRRLNEDASYFAHSSSCWWGSYSESRCALKSWGGLGMRSFVENDWGTTLTGRAWVQPITKEIAPTSRTVGAHGYIVYNGYGVLDSYIPARIIAHLAGMTYRKIDFSADPQYVNSGGYLVSDEATCSETDSITFEFDLHRSF